MMSREDIIDGLRFTAGMVTFNPWNGETITPEELNEQDKLTYDACMSAIDLLKAQEPKPVKDTLVVGGHLMGKCPKCYKVLTIQDHPVACGFCGQAVKWE
jgi:hypothetical protein